MKILAPAKVNLYLEIVRKREDGYHDLKTVFHTVGLYDILEVSVDRKNNGRKIDLKIIPKTASASAHCPNDESNIVWKAANLFLDEFKINKSCKIILTKQIPIQAGLGGGSSDAAAVLKALSRLFLKSRPQKKLRQIAAKLGADVPFFLNGGCALAQGIGEKITPLPPSKNFWMVIVKPQMGLSTPQVYRWHDEIAAQNPFQQGISCPEGGLTCRQKLHIIKKLINQNTPVKEWASCLFNSFEFTVFKKYPELSHIKRSLIELGACNALLSGSGSAFFAPVSSKKAGEEIRKKLKGFQGETWIVRSVP